MVNVEHCNICWYTCEYNCLLCEMTALKNCLWFWSLFGEGYQYHLIKKKFPFNGLIINPNSMCQCVGVKMPSSLLTATTGWRKLRLDIRGSWDKRGGLLACRHAEEKSNGPVKLSVASKVVLIKDYYERAWRYCQMCGLLWKYHPQNCNRRQEGQVGWLINQRERVSSWMHTMPLSKVPQRCS